MKSKTIFSLNDVSNYNDKTCKYINSKTKGQIMKEFKLCLSNHKRPITDNMHNLPLVTCITYMRCYGFKKCLKIYLVPDLSQHLYYVNIKAPSKDIASFFKLFY